VTATGTGGGATAATGTRGSVRTGSTKGDSKRVGVGAIAATTAGCLSSSSFIARSFSSIIETATMARNNSARNTSRMAREVSFDAAAADVSITGAATRGRSTAGAAGAGAVDTTGTGFTDTGTIATVVAAGATLFVMDFPAGSTRAMDDELVAGGDWKGGSSGRLSFCINAARAAAWAGLSAAPKEAGPEAKMRQRLRAILIFMK